MANEVIETKYPLSFRKEDAEKLGEHLKLRHSVEIVGLKRVGISDFLRFFLYHRGIVKKYLGGDKRHLFIVCDLNDLVEREIFPFWILTFKRLADAVDDLKIDQSIKKEIASLFLEAIQTQDLFLTCEYLREALVKVVEAGFLPAIFYIRFDRLIEAVDSQFFANLEGLVDACNQKLAYVFTSFRAIDDVFKEKIDRNFLHVFANVLWIKPASHKDTEIIFNAFKKRYKLKVKKDLEEKLITFSGGHVQYLHLLMVILAQKTGDNGQIDKNLPDLVLSDERIKLQSEEIWESLDGSEEAVLLKIHAGKKPAKGEKQSVQYLWESGLVENDSAANHVFSPLFDHFLKIKAGEAQEAEAGELTKKEKLLFDLLLVNLDKVCEREKIIEAVWPEEVEFGVSDWTIDRLVARLREKLKTQKSQYQVITVKTRGFKLAKNP